MSIFDLKVIFVQKKTKQQQQ